MSIEMSDYLSEDMLESIDREGTFLLNQIWRINLMLARIKGP